VTISPDTPTNTHRRSERSSVTEPPEDTSSSSRGAKVLWMFFLVVFAMAGIYLVAIIFSLGVELLTDGPPADTVPKQSAPVSPVQPVQPMDDQ